MHKRYFSEYSGNEKLRRSGAAFSYVFSGSPALQVLPLKSFFIMQIVFSTSIFKLTFL